MTTEAPQPLAEAVEHMIAQMQRRPHGWIIAGTGAMDNAVTRVLQALSSLPPVNTDQSGGEALTPEAAWQDLVEKDDRTSPEECPDMALITFEELQDYMLSAIPQPAEPGALREEVARIIHEHQGNGDPDELIHHPAAKSWDEPTEPRWSQWLEIADAILNLTQADARRIAELERQIGSWRSQCMDEEERRNTAEARAEALSAEVERLKAGLEEIGATANNNTVADGYRLARIATKARRLLTDPTPTTEGES